MLIHYSEDLESVAPQTADRNTPLSVRMSCFRILYTVKTMLMILICNLLLPYRLSRLGPGLAWGDVDGDNDLDLFMGQSRTSGSELFLQQEGGSFVKKEQSTFQILSSFLLRIWGLSFWMLIRMATLICMSHPVDMIHPWSLYLRDRLFLNQGEGDFVLGLPNTPDLQDAGGAVCAADFDRDGDLDLFVGGRIVPGKYPVTPNSRLLVNQAGVFSDQTENLAPQLMKAGLVNSAVWSDYDGDGWIDLFIASEWGPIRVWKNEDGKLQETTEDLGFSNTTGWWTSILPPLISIPMVTWTMRWAILDTTRKYTASSKEPLVLHWGDMDGIR